MSCTLFVQSGGPAGQISMRDQIRTIPDIAEPDRGKRN